MAQCLSIFAAPVILTISGFQHLYHSTSNGLSFDIHPFAVHMRYVCILADSGFFKNFLYQGGAKSTVFLGFEDLKFKISDSYLGRGRKSPILVRTF